MFRQTGVEEIKAVQETKQICQRADERPKKTGKTREKPLTEKQTLDTYRKLKWPTAKDEQGIIKLKEEKMKEGPETADWT